MHPKDLQSPAGMHWWVQQEEQAVKKLEGADCEPDGRNYRQGRSLPPRRCPIIHRDICDSPVLLGAETC
jgi:hypothetical protein